MMTLNQVKPAIVGLGSVGLPLAVEYGITPVQRPAAGSYDAAILAVAHREFAAMGAAKSDLRL